MICNEENDKYCESDICTGNKNKTSIMYPCFCAKQAHSRIEAILLGDQITVIGNKCGFNPLNPHDALKHHFASLKNDLISCT